MHRTFTASLAALSLASVLAAASPASAGGWNHHWNGPLAAGVVGGLALGAIAGAGYPSAAYYYDPPVYEGCYIARRPAYDGWGEFVGYRRVRVCE
jgi:hypothetical protein